MFKSLILLSFVVAVTCNLVYAEGRLIPQSQYDKVVGMHYKIKIVGDALVGEKIDNKKSHDAVSYRSPIISLITNPFTINYSESDFITSTTFTPTNGRTIYDMQSSGSPMQIWQNPNNPNDIHCVYMNVDYNDPLFTNRTSKYYYSSDKGVTWAFISEVPNGIRSGYVCITGMSDGNILVANHSNAPGSPATTHSQAFADIFPGLGQFERLDPGAGNFGANPIWPRVIATSSITNPNKFFLISSQHPMGDSTFFNIGTSLTTPGTFTGWTTQYDCEVNETYNVARGDDGRIGVVYINSKSHFPNDVGDVYFIESTNDGTTFSTPLKIFDSDFSATGDSLGAMRGVSIAYQYNKPKVVYEIIRQDPLASQYLPFWPNKIMFWSTTLPGSDPNRSVIVADSNTVWLPKDSLFAGVDDGFGPLCRPVIGRSSDNNALFTAFISITNKFGAPVDTTNFHAIYLSASGDGGATWKTPERITPEAPVMDWTYPSMTPVNDVDANNYFVNMSIQKDTIPGSFVNGDLNGPSLAQQMFTRVTISRDSIPIGIKNISSEIPGTYTLFQNYPNPFNPSTSIKFALPEKSNILLIVYDINGREIAKLINNEAVSPGVKEINFITSGLSSGIYFYTLVAGDFSATKKMVLLK
ncbi:T9SS type A sorting domain-containing protein [Bacteroidota bacterium]